MRKKYWILSLIMGILGAAPLLAAPFSGVENLTLERRIEREGDRYAITATAVVNTRGVFSLESAEIRFAVLNAAGVELVAETLPAQGKLCRYSLTYYADGADAVPVRIVAETVASRFRTVPALIGCGVLLALAVGSGVWLGLHGRGGPGRDADATPPDPR